MKFLLVFVFILSFYRVAGQTDVLFSSFKGSLVGVKNISQIDEPKVYEYVDSSLSQVEKRITYDSPEMNIPENTTIFSLNYDTVTIKPYIELVSRFAFYYQGKESVILKYRIFEQGNPSPFKTILTHKSNGLWLRFEDSYLDNIVEVFRILSLEAFYQFYNEEDDSDFPEINKLKPLVKENGFLNIFKLSQVINSNRELLSKYLGG